MSRTFAAQPGWGQTSAASSKERLISIWSMVTWNSCLLSETFSVGWCSVALSASFSPPRPTKIGVITGATAITRHTPVTLETLGSALQGGLDLHKRRRGLHRRDYPDLSLVKSRGSNVSRTP